MYDYMRSLQKQFEPKPEFFQNLDGDIRQIHKQLSARLEPEDRKLLLKLIDMEDLLHSEARLHDFISGYRLACAIHLELAEDPMYAFEKDEELRQCCSDKSANCSVSALVFFCAFRVLG